MSLFSRYIKPTGYQLIVAAFVVAGFATILFIVDLAYVLTGPAKRMWARKQPRLQLGTMDYFPEYLKAAASFVSAQGRLNASTNTVSASMAKASSQLAQETDLTKRQSIAIAIAWDINAFCAVMGIELPALAENADIIHESLGGYVKIATDPLPDLVALRKQMRDVRVKIGNLRESLRIAQRNTKSLHRQNRNVQLNQATDRQLAGLREYDRIESRVQRTLSRVGGSLRRKIWVRSVQRIVRRTTG